ncbi:uncharacterized protein TNIN_332241 [Trichonephila inaurata madagascariensis]|uniref:PHD finger protein 21A n=1 Tax=Trichonephila inaurata madagascariensis TaxID=2747483 RepID=A0A8X6X7C7_9ARAC|nr:uncharacterized protein TNIN_332241 [Trichonephila inaurata madagascariensis]
MDLQTISSQMKVVIQKHQIVVTEMRNDPQNPVLQKRLNDLKLEIQTLNERQKQVVQDLRKNLEVKQCCPNSCPQNSSGCPAASHPPSPLIPNQEIRMLCCAPKYPVKNHKLPTTTLATKPVINCVNTVRQTVPPTLNNIATPTATFTFKAPVGTVVLPNCSAANTLKVAEHQKMHPVLVVPSPSNRTVDGAHTGVLFNLVPPIRVPQYPPPLPRISTPITCQKNQVLNNCIPVAIASIPSISTPPNNIVEHPVVMAASQSPPMSSTEKVQPPQVTEKISHKIEQRMDVIQGVTLLTVLNWEVWKVEDRVSLMHYGVWEFIEKGKERSPEEEAKLSWRDQCDLKLRKDRAFTLIYQSVSN